MAALGEARLREMEALRALRLANEGKLLAPSPDMETRVCLCHKAPAAPMVQCELCRDAFHTGCVAAPSAPHGPRVWLCPHCRRSEKPPLERVLPLLASLQRIRVRLPEGDALRYVIERTVSWQHRAQQLLASGGLRPAHDRGGPGRPQSRGQASAGQASDSKAPLPPGTASPPLPDGRDSRTSLALSPFAAGRSCVPLHGVSAEVNELLMEAHLLQVSLPEVHELYRTLLARPSPPPRTEQNSPARPGGEKDCCRGKRDGVSSLERKLKRRLERDGHASERWDRVRKTRAPRRKKVRRSRPEATDAVLSESTRGCEPARTGGTHPPPSDTSCSEQEDSEAEEAICPAVSCLQPEGDEVDWVQCDGSCNQWFHQVCVGVSPEMAEKEDYVCVRCTVRDAPSRK